MTTARGDHAASTLNDGRILVSGGIGDWGAGQRSPAIGSSEILDLTTNSWTSASSLNHPRYGHTQTVLNDGSLLAVGGSPNGVKDLPPEIYNAASDTWTETSKMSYARRLGHTATLMANGEVLVTGGLAEVEGNKKIIAKAEIYNPKDGSWRLVSDMTMPREKHHAVLLNNGKILVIGSDNEEQYVRGVTTAELYDPDNDTWTALGPLLDEHAEKFTAVLLNDGKVLVSGGGTKGRRLTPETTATMEVYDPDNATWSLLEPMPTRSWRHTATVLNNGNVLFVGNEKLSIYNTSSDNWTPIGGFSNPRGGVHTSVLLSDGRTLIIGGHDINLDKYGGLSVRKAIDSVLVYDPALEW
tara:strand:- start:3186 stop:4250 length:1065 start_codon:yes stop_codon:yes gene_type:complete